MLHEMLDPLNISTVIAAVTLIVITVGYYIMRDWGVPPGPAGLPIVGYWPFVRSDTFHLKLFEMKKKYGDVFSLRITGKLYINLASLKVIREAHATKSDCFAERTEDYNLIGAVLENGVVYSKGEKWQTVRKFFMNQFRERGMTVYKENTDEAMNEEIKVLIQELQAHSGKPVNILRVLENKSNKVIRQTLFSERSPVSEEQLFNIQENYRLVASIFHSSNMVLIGNIARYFIVPFLPTFSAAMKRHHAVKVILQEIIEQHRRTLEENDNRDVIDSFIREKIIRKSKGDHTHEYFTDENLVANLLQFVGDGVANLALFATFFLKTLLDFPEEQEKIYQELVEVCGDRNPVLADKNKLLYTNAFLLEAQRYNNFLPIFPSLQCTKETTIGGYRIPKGAVTLTNIYGIHNDPQLYEDPHKFDVTRFLSKEGKPKAESPITFGVGKRVCLGESFVMMQAFLYCTAIVKNFRISYYQHSKTVHEIVTTRKLDVNVVPRK